MKILFDTNVLFAAFITHGVCAGLYEESLQHAQIVVSEDILTELAEKLIVKAKLSPSEASEVVLSVRANAEVVKATPILHAICRDPDDGLILAAAFEAKVDLLVTGDQDLLILKEYQNIPILNPRDCLIALGTR